MTIPTNSSTLKQPIEPHVENGKHVFPIKSKDNLVLIVMDRNYASLRLSLGNGQIESYTDLVAEAIDNISQGLAQALVLVQMPGWPIEVYEIEREVTE